MLKTEEVAKLAIDGAEITFDNERQRWQVGGQDVRRQTIESWQRQGFLKDDDFQKTSDNLKQTGGYKRYYLLNDEGKKSLKWIYFPDPDSPELPE